MSEGIPILHELAILVGVTGHRDPVSAQLPALRIVVKRFFDDLRARTPALPIIVYSSLAEGADRLVAEVALDLGFDLVVPLPFSQERYEADFADRAGSVEQFRALLDRARYAYVVDDAAAGRESGYAAAGLEIANAVHVMLALWDGERGDDIGGTSWLVTKRLEFNAPYAGPVVHIRTQRTRTPALAISDVDSYEWITPPDVRPSMKSLADCRLDVCRKFQSFNRTNASIAAPPERSDVSEDVPYFLAADRVAVRFRTLTTVFVGAIFALIFISALGFAMFAHLDPHSQVWFLVYFIAFCAAGGVWVIGRVIADVQNRFQAYRAYAEGLRVLRFWRTAGISTGSAQRAFGRYLKRDEREVAWIREALRMVAALSSAAHRSRLRNGSAAAAMEAPSERFQRCLDDWIYDQLGYYVDKGRRNQRLAKAASVSAGMLAALSTLVTVFVFIGIVAAGRPWSISEPIRGALFVLSATLAVLAAIVHSLAEKLAWSEQAKEYARMQEIFSRARVELLALLDRFTDESLPQALQTLERLGEEALEQNEMWLFIHRERPIEFPGAT